jgi:hypothetical protein
VNAGRVQRRQAGRVAQEQNHVSRFVSAPGPGPSETR